MAYKLIVTEHADELFDAALQYLAGQLKNKQAAHLFDEVEKTYARLERGMRTRRRPPSMYATQGGQYA